MAFLMITYKLELALLFGRKYDNATIKTFVVKFHCVHKLNEIAHANGESHSLLKIGVFQYDS